MKELESTKQKGNAAFTSGNNEEALKLYRAALLICPNNKLTNAKLHANIAAVYMKLRNYEEAAKVRIAFRFVVKLNCFTNAFDMNFVCNMSFSVYTAQFSKLHKAD